MNNDLISREALKEQVKNEVCEVCFDSPDERQCSPNCKLCTFKQLIDNAPTVEYTFEEAFQKTVCEQRLYCPQRPQCEWITIGEEQGALGIIYKIRKCSKCGWEHSLVIPDNFCPNCGAQMKGGAE